MAKARKDLRGRALKPGEFQRKDDQRYMYSYTDPLGRRKFIYANDLTELREKEQKLQRDQQRAFMDYKCPEVHGCTSIPDTASSKASKDRMM